MELDINDTWITLQPATPIDLQAFSLKRRVFTPGNTYTFTIKNGRHVAKTGGFHSTKIRRLIFLRDEAGAGSVVHHLFRSDVAGWIESFTDAQCLEFNIKEH